MSVVTWRITLHLEAPTPTAAAVQAFCAVRHPDTLATLFDVDGIDVDLTKEIHSNPALRDAGECVHYLLPPSGEGKVAGPFELRDLMCISGAGILTIYLLTGRIEVTHA